jgi:hypothetical protein
MSHKSSLYLRTSQRRNCVVGLGKRGGLTLLKDSVTGWWSSSKGVIVEQFLSRWSFPVPGHSWSANLSDSGWFSGF